MTSRRSSLTTLTAKRGAALLTAVLASAGLAACADNSSDYEYSASFTPKSASPVAESSEMTTSSSSPSSEASHDPEPTRSTQSSSPRNCGVDKEASEIYSNIHKVPEDGSGMPWFYDGYSNYDPCTDLSFAVLHHRTGASRFQSRQIMLFHQGEYLGVGSDQLTAHVDIVNITNDSITVKYMDPNGRVRSPEEDYANALDVTYRWDGEKVQMLGYDG